MAYPLRTLLALTLAAGSISCHGSSADDDYTPTIYRQQTISQIPVAASPPAPPPPPVVTQLPPPPPPAPIVVAPPASPDALRSAIDAIRQAPDPSSAVTAYTDASAHLGRNLSIDDAYVHKMISFGLPDLADAQAQDILRQDPTNNAARTVVAYEQARRGQTTESLDSIIKATAGQPDSDVEEFTVRTAGQLLAWFDTQADKSTIPAPTRDALETMRHRLLPRDAYLQAYTSARAVYEGRPPVADTAPLQQSTTIEPAYIEPVTVYPSTYDPYTPDYDYHPYSVPPVFIGGRYNDHNNRDWNHDRDHHPPIPEPRYHGHDHPDHPQSTPPPKTNLGHDTREGASHRPDPAPPTKHPNPAPHADKPKSPAPAPANRPAAPAPAKSTPAPSRPAPTPAPTPHPDTPNRGGNDKSHDDKNSSDSSSHRPPGR